MKAFIGFEGLCHPYFDIHQLAVDDCAALKVHADVGAIITVQSLNPRSANRAASNFMYGRTVRDISITAKIDLTLVEPM